MAIVFLFVLFSIKTSSKFENEANQGLKTEGLAYSSAVIEDLVNRDSDSDGLLDWEEQLWGTDPSQKETTPGIPDGEAVNKLKGEQTVGEKSAGTPTEENLTETDKFSRELFSTVATLSQSGTLDDATIEKISNSLAENLQNSVQRKIFTLADIKIVENNPQNLTNYNNALNTIFKKNELNYSVEDVLQKFVGDKNEADANALIELEPIAKEISKKIEGVKNMNVPKSLITLHLNFLNAMEKVLENITDIKLYEKDAIVSLIAMNQYEQNIQTLEEITQNLVNALTKALNNQ